MNQSSSAPKQKVHSPDFTVQDEGTTFLLTPVSDLAVDWADHRLPQDAQRWGSAFVVEHRYIADIVLGARRDGLTVEEE